MNWSRGWFRNIKYYGAFNEILENNSNWPKAQNFVDKVLEQLEDIQRDIERTQKST